MPTKRDSWEDIPSDTSDFSDPSDTSETPSTLLDLAFPTYDNCPTEDDIDLNYYDDRNGIILAPFRHWCLLAEITHLETFIRPRVFVRDRSGEEFSVCFYLDGGERPDMRPYKKGHTVAVLYAHQHLFLDMSQGIRQEDLETVQVIPLSLDRVMQAVKDPNVQPESCQVCKTAKPKLSKCARCGRGWYCGTDCQKTDWVSGGHKSACKGLGMVQKMVDRDWTNYVERFQFPF